MGGTCASCPRLPRFPAECVEPEPIQWRDDAPDVEDVACPVLLIRDWRPVFTSHTFAQTGVLPFPGGWAQQHPVLIEALEIVAGQRAIVEYEKAQEARRESGG